ncbi:MAG: L-ribulose-5-phosphate 4-epimerase AraD [Methylacidiphilales bacterium]|nr:L-ribulose-5-phosphate 4-epimerase AraD [Candidatus Methylacidiphilales bacterium]
MNKYRDLQQECYEANLALPKYGLVDLTFGNVSVLDAAKGIVAIKPSGVDYEKLKAEDMVLLDLGGKQVGGNFRPSSDTATHIRLYRAFAGIRSVAHSHSRYAVAFAQAARSIPCLGTTHADYFHGEVPVTRPMTAKEIQGSYELETGNVIVERFKELDPLHIPAVLVHGHGPFVWGTSGLKAVENAFALELVAEMAWRTMQINPQAGPLSTALLDKHFLRKHGAGAYYGQK